MKYALGCALKLTALLLISSSSFTACGISNAVSPMKPSGFLPAQELSKKDDSFPFRHSNVAAADFRSHYDQLMIAPVTDVFLNGDTWVESASVFIRSRESYEARVHRLTKFAGRALQREFTRSRTNHFTIVAAPGRRALVLEVAITEVVFGDPLLHAATSLLPIFGGSQLFSAVRNPVVAFEAVLRDSYSGEVVATFADRRLPQVRLLDLNKFTVNSANREIIEYWAEQLVASLNKAPQEVVDERMPVTLALW